MLLASSSSDRSSTAKPSRVNAAAMRGLGAIGDLHADEQVRGALVGDAVVELGDVARARAAGRSGGRAALLGDGDGELPPRASPTSARSATKRRRSKFMLAPQATAIRLRRCLRVAPRRSEACHCQRAGGSRMLRVSSNTSLMAAVSVGVDGSRSRRRTGTGGRFRAPHASPPAVGEQADLGQGDAASGFKRTRYGVGVVRAARRSRVISGAPFDVGRDAR